MKQNLRRRIFYFPLLTMFVFHASMVSASEIQDVLDEAKSLLRAGDADGAYVLLRSHEENYTGSDAFDYLLGVAALDSGNAGEAIFSLQRLVVKQPDFAGARLELARAYYEVGDNELARREFDKIMAEDPPDNVKAAVDNYMAAIEGRAKSYQPTLEYFLDIGAGHDENPAAATADDQFLSFILDDRNVEKSSAYAEAIGGVTYSRPLSATTQLLLSGKLSHRSHPSTHYVDPTTAELSSTLGFRSGNNSGSVGLTAAKFNLDGRSNKIDTGLLGSYSRTLSEKWSFDAYGRYGQLRFEDELEVQDVDQWMVGLGTTYTGDSYRISVGLLGAEDDAQQVDAPFSNESFGIQVAGMWVRPGQRIITLNAVAMETDFDDPFFGFDRDDDLYSITLAHTWNRFPSPQWSITLSLTYSEKNSSVDLYDFDRVAIGINIRRVFK